MQGEAGKRKVEVGPSTEDAPGTTAKRTKREKKPKTPPVSGAAAPSPDDEGYVRLTPVPRTLLFVLSEDDTWRPVRLHTQDKAPSMTLSEDRTSVTSAKGYRMARASHGTHEGAWYFEVAVTRLGATGHVRLGWATRDAEVQAPVGFDQHSFGYRDKAGHKVYKGLREEYGAAYKEGDVVGCYLYLPPGGRALTRKKGDVTKQKGQYFFFEDEGQPKARALEGSIIAFAVNGAFQGVAYRDIVQEGTYFPAASIFTQPKQTEGATLTFNFGPDFAFPLDAAAAAAGLPPPQPASELAGPPPPPPLTPEEVIQRHRDCALQLNVVMRSAASNYFLENPIPPGQTHDLPMDLKNKIADMCVAAAEEALKEMSAGSRPFMPPEALDPAAFLNGTNGTTLPPGGILAALGINHFSAKFVINERIRELQQGGKVFLQPAEATGGTQGPEAEVAAVGPAAAAPGGDMAAVMAAPGP